MESQLLGRSSATSGVSVPSVELGRLAGLIADHLQTLTDAPANPLRIAGSRATLDTVGLLSPLARSLDFAQAFEPGEASAGFLADLVPPPAGAAARIGSNLAPGRQEETFKNIERLQKEVVRLVDVAVADTDIAKIVHSDMAQAMEQLSRSINLRSFKLPDADAKVVPISFASRSKRAPGAQEEVARILSAIETVDGRDVLEIFLTGIEGRLRKDHGDEEAEEMLLAAKAARLRPDSDLQRFVQFLDDQALSRVRLQVTMRMMKAIAHLSRDALLKAYVDRVVGAYELIGSLGGQTIEIDVATVWGQGNNVDMASQLRRALFYSCLPVWPQWPVQLFDAATYDADRRGFGAMREVTYRMRLNGINPKEGRPAYEVRVEGIAEQLREAKGNPKLSVSREIAELFFLALTIPNEQELGEDFDLMATAQRMAQDIKADPRRALLDLFQQCKARAGTVNKLASATISTIKDKSRDLIQQTNDTVRSFTISIAPGIVNWASIERGGRDTEFLMRNPRGGDDSIEWLRHVTVSDRAYEPSGIASYHVKTEIMDRALVRNGEPRTMPLQRDLRGAALVARIIPGRAEAVGEMEKWRELDPGNLPFGTQNGLDILYDVRFLRTKRADIDKAPRGEQREANQIRLSQLRAARISAFMILTYAFLYEIQRRLLTVHPGMTTLLLRVHGLERSKDLVDESLDGSSALYAVCQTIERALAREGLTKLQGITTQVAGKTIDPNRSYKEKGALYALLGGQPIAYEDDGSLDKVAMITYVTRPCDSHPQIPGLDSHLFTHKTYVAVRQADGNMRLQIMGMGTKAYTSRDEFKDPKPLFEQVHALKLAGFDHIMLVSQDFGNRHIGRAAERHTPHASREFFEKLGMHFPGAHIYTLRRDVFPAVRLQQKGPEESIFEVINFNDHVQMFESLGEDIIGSVEPVYTIATLHVIGRDAGEKRPQSGFCTYFLDTKQLARSTSAHVQHNIRGIGAEAAAIRKSLVGLLRGVHFLECEKTPSARDATAQAVLDPFDWVRPSRSAAAGEIEVLRTRSGRVTLLALPALLEHVTRVFHKE